MPHKLPFRVVHVSSQDEHFPAAELNSHSPATRGWISSRFCTFPQQLVFTLQERAHLRKIQVLSHQYMIASKIEFFVGDLRDDDMRHYQNARYTRLGYVSLSDNRSTEFKARELKSVHVDATGTYVQLLLHKNYANEHNLYNQVSLIAVNLIGDAVHKSPSINETPRPTSVVQRPDFIPPTEDLAFDIYQDPEVANIIRQLEKQKHACVSQEQFDQAQKIRDAIGYLQRVGERLGRLALEKQQAVEQENYERAKLKKFQINELRTNLYRDLDLINLLSNAPVPERVQANGDGVSLSISTDACDQKQKVRRPSPVRLQALEELANQNGQSKHSTVDPTRPASPSPSQLQFSPNRPHVSRPMDPDERPLPALRRNPNSNNNSYSDNRTGNGSVFQQHHHHQHPVSLLEDDDRTLSDQASIMSIDPPSTAVDRLVVHPGNQPALEPIEDESSEVLELEEWEEQEGLKHALDPSDYDMSAEPSQPEPLSESQRRQASVAIEVVGLELVTMALSKMWAFREKALLELEKRVTAPKLPPPASLPDSALPDPHGELRSTTFLLKRALDDQVLSIFRLATYFLKPLVVDFVDRHAIPRPELHYALDKLIPVLVRRTGDTALRIREIAKKQILGMAQWPQLRHSTTFWNELVRPLPPVALDRLALSRMELVTELYAARGVEPASTTALTETPGSYGVPQCGFTLDAVATFTAQALTHRSNEVREAAENLMVALYRAENRAIIRRCMPPPEDVNTQRHPLYRRLFGKFERIDSKYAPVNPASSYNGALPDTEKKQRDLEALHAEVQQVRAMMHGDARGQSRVRPSQPPVRSRPSKPESNKRHPTQQRKPPPPQQQQQQQQQQPSPRAVAKVNSHSDQTSSHPKATSPDRSLTGPIGQLTSEAELLLSLDKTCIFCGEHSDAFTEEGLDLHYWKDCPMLHRCANCKQVVEIAGMVEHLLHECEAAPPGHYVRCGRCSEAVLRSELDTHPCIPNMALLNSSGTATTTNTSANIRCPLCHTDLPVPCSEAGSSIAPGGPEDVWKSHLLGGDHPNLPACAHNPRRPIRSQQAIHIGSTVTAAKATAGKSSASLHNRVSASPPRRPQPTPPPLNKPNYQSGQAKSSVPPRKSGIPRPTQPAHVRPV